MTDYGKMKEKEKGKWILLNQEGRTTAISAIARTSESSVTLFIIPV